MKRLLIIPLAALLIGCLASSCTSSTSKKENGNNNDSITAANSEAARLDSLRQDSIARRNFTSPDLAFKELHGDVKTCKLSIRNYVHESNSFSEDGKLLSSTNGVATYKFMRDKYGYIIKSHTRSKDESFRWENGRVSSRNIDELREEGVLTRTTYYYDSDGLLAKSTSPKGDDCSEVEIKDCVWTYSNYKFDEMGNWIARNVKMTYKLHDWTQDYPEDYWESRSESYKETRTITYYKSKGGGSNPVANSANQNQAIADYKSNKQKKTQESKPEPEESHNNYNYSESYSYSSSDNMSFSSPQDVMRYLDGRTFSGGGVSVKIGYNTVYINGSAVSGAPVISNITPTTATIRASSPYMGGQDLRFYLNANSGTISLDSGERLYSR